MGGSALMNRIRAGGSLRTFEDETASLIRRMTTAPTGARTVIMDDTIRALKAQGLWAKLDAFYMLATAAADQALLNWKGTSFNCTVGGTMTFTADQGYAGNGTDGRLDTGFNPATAGGQYAQNSAHCAIYSRTSAQVVPVSFGHQNVIINPRSAANEFAGRINRASSLAIATGVTNGAGYHAHSRTAADAWFSVKDTTVFPVNTGASAALVSTNFWIGSWNGTTPQYGTAQIACSHFGSGLTSAELVALGGIVTSHLARIGAAV
jgi:hypothetical protein